jgi:uncharacterized membrane protein YagU involved in acid resistance
MEENTNIPLLKQVLCGAAAGLIASIPMGLLMKGMDSYLPRRPDSHPENFEPLPPKKIIREASRKATGEELTKPGTGWEPTIWLAHLAFGATTASLYPLLTQKLRIPPVVRGMLFALGVWAISYQGWIPKAEILPPASEQPARRNLIMVTSHLLWGSLMSLLELRLAKGEK